MDESTKERLREEVQDCAQTINESYWRLGELLHAIAETKAYKSWGYKGLKSFVESECDVCQGPTAEVARKIHKFFAFDAKEQLAEHREKYDHLIETAQKVAAKKLSTLMKNQGAIAPEHIDDVLEKLEKVSTKDFTKAFTPSSKKEEPKSDMVKKTFKLTPDQSFFVDQALSLYGSSEKEDLSEALVRLCTEALQKEQGEDVKDSID